MLKLKWRHYLIYSGVLSLFSYGCQANVDVGITVAMPIHPPVGVVVSAPPSGYTECYITPAQWFEGRYYPAHRECIYESGMVYAPGFWSYASGSWAWVSGHWGEQHAYYHQPRYAYTANHGYVEHGYAQDSHRRYHEINRRNHETNGRDHEVSGKNHGVYGHNHEANGRSHEHGWHR